VAICRQPTTVPAIYGRNFYGRFSDLYKNVDGSDKERYCHSHSHIEREGPGNRYCNAERNA